MSSLINSFWSTFHIQSCNNGSFWPHFGDNIDISTPFEVNIMNLLANSRLFTHPAVTEQHCHLRSCFCQYSLSLNCCSCIFRWYLLVDCYCYYKNINYSHFKYICVLIVGFFNICLVLSLRRMFMGLQHLSGWKVTSLPLCSSQTLFVA